MSELNPKRVKEKRKRKKGKEIRKYRKILGVQLCFRRFPIDGFR